MSLILFFQSFLVCEPLWSLFLCRLPHLTQNLLNYTNNSILQPLIRPEHTAAIATAIYLSTWTSIFLIFPHTEGHVSVNLLNLHCLSWLQWCWTGLKIDSYQIYTSLQTVTQFGNVWSRGHEIYYYGYEGLFPETWLMGWEKVSLWYLAGFVN